MRHLPIAVKKGSSNRFLSKLIRENDLDHVLNHLQDHHVALSRDVAYALLQRCMQERALVYARKVHLLMINNRLNSIPVLADHLIRLFTSCGSLCDANDVFQKVSKRTLYTWNAIIQAHTMFGDGNKAFHLYQAMQEDGFVPERRTFSSVLKACTSIRSLQYGRLIHDDISRSKVELDVAVGNALIDCYSKCGSLEEAQRVFDKLPCRNVVSWAAIIAGYVQHGQALMAYQLFESMQADGIQPDKVVFISVLQACGSIQLIEQGKLIHGQLLEAGHEKDTTIGNVLVDMYGKCAALEDAEMLCIGFCNRDIVTWGSLISGYVQQAEGTRALALFEKMQLEGLKPDKLVFSSAVKACEILESLGQGRCVYNQILLAGLELDVVVGSTLVDMLANCGSLNEAQLVFDMLPCHDVVSWGAMIAAWLEHGDIQAAFECLNRMLSEGLVPEEATMLCILRACGTTGAIKQARLIHDKIIRHRYETVQSVRNMIVDVYAKCGSLDEACQMFKKLACRTATSWGSLITAYAKDGDWSLALEWFDEFKAQGIKPDGVIYLGVLVACSQGGLLPEGRSYFKSMIEEHGITPNIEHYNCLVDILGRAGLLKEAEDILRSIPLGLDIIGWTSLLTGCETYGNAEVGHRCYHQMKHLDPSHASGYVLLSNTLANSDSWNDADEA